MAKEHPEPIQSLLDQILEGLKRQQKNQQDATQTASESANMGNSYSSKEPIDCPKCRNLGCVPNPSDPERWQDCECVPLRKAWRAIKRSGLAEEIERCTFETYETPDLWMRELLASARAYTESILAGKKGWFLALGQSGSGKTHLCTAICGELLRAGKQVQYVSWRNLLIKGKQRFDSEAGSENTEYIEALKVTPVLYIDDLFKGKTSEADDALVFELLNDRLIRKLPTLISSELSVEQLLNRDEATGSRMIEMAKREGQLAIIPRNRSKNYRIAGLKV